MLRHRLVFLLCLGLAWVGLVVLLIGPPPRAARAAATLCVQPGNVSCYSSITAALAAAQNGDTIRVVAGTYIEYVIITKTVTLQGGWNAAFTARDPVVNVTTIRPPDSTFSVVHIQGPASPTLDGFTITGGGGGNHGGGLRVTSSNAVVSNNVITGNTGYLLGGGVWVQNGAPRLENNRIQNNVNDGQGQTTYGGGVELEGTQATLVNNIIAGNVVSATGNGYGGGVDISGGGPVTLTNNTIFSNVVEVADPGTGYGGGVSIQSVTATLSSNVISNNVLSATTGYGGGVDITGGQLATLTGNSILNNRARSPYNFGYSYGGGVSIRGVTVTLSSNVVQGNTANPTPSGVGYGGGVFITSAPTFSLIGNTFANNIASTYNVGYGGGAYIVGSAGTAADNIFNNNLTTNSDPNFSAYGYGAGLWVGSGTLVIRGGQISGNQVLFGFTGPGGGLYADSSQITLDAVRVQNNSATSDASALMFVNSPYTLTNVVASGNTGPSSIVGILAQDSPGLLVNNTIAANTGDGIRTASPLTLTNNIIMSHTVGVSLTAAVPVSATYNAFYANGTNSLGFSLGAMNITQTNPLLDSDYHLASASQLIDAGTHTNAPSTDFDGEPRPMAGTSGLFKVDIGADERTGAAQRNVDLDAGGADLTIIGPGNPPENPGSTGSNDWIGYAVLGQDINGDGRADLVAAAEDWADDFVTLNSTGRLYGLFNFGARLTGTVDLLTDTASITIASQYLLQHIGSDLAGDDLNGDGKGDLIVGSFQDDNMGGGAVTPTVFALWGGPSLAGTRTLTNSSPADFMLRAPGQDFYAFAAKNALTTGDLNGDGVADLVVGDYKADDGATADTGAIFVVFGGSNLSGALNLSTTAADYTLYGAAADTGLGYAAVGRVNAGSQLDLVARPYTDTTKAYVILGPVTSGARHLSSASASITITGLQAGGVIVMDLTGDGQDDVILGSGSNLYVVPGPLVGGQTYAVASSAMLTITGVPAGSLALGQVAGDSKPDLIVGAPSLKQAFVIPGGLAATGTVSILDAAQIVVKGTDNSVAKNLGFDVAPGDLDLDNRPDLIISTWAVDVDTHPNNFTDAGKVYVIYSAADVAPSQQKIYLPLVLK